MPIYEFDCPSCGECFDDLVSKPDDRVPCPHCGSVEVVKRFSTFNPGPGTGAAPPASMPCGASSPAT